MCKGKGIKKEQEEEEEEEEIGYRWIIGRSIIDSR